MKGPKTISVIDQIKKLERQLIDEGASPDTLIMSIGSYHKLHSALQKTAHEEILILTYFGNLKIRVHPLCSDDQIHIIDSNFFCEDP